MTRRRIMIRNLSKTLIACLMLLASPSFAGTMKVTDLVEERALVELGRAMPTNGFIDIRLAEGTVSEGEFIQEFWIDAQSGQFIANVVTEYGETHRVWGIAVLTIEIPVPARRMLPDEIVQYADLSMVELPMQRVGKFAVHSVENLVGQQVRRMLVAGRPVPRQSVVPPKIINRGQKVKILLNYGGLRITANGRAMADAYAGQELRVVNLSSNKAVSGVATAAGVVEVEQ